VGILDKLAQVFGASPPPPAAAPPPPAASVDYEDKRIPEAAKERIRRLLACLNEIEALMAREQIPGFSKIDMEQMRDIHLPKLVKSYIDIPPAHRSEIFRKTGKSAVIILNESLDQMQGRLDELMRNLAQHDIDAFTNNTRFIGQRYSDGDPFG
jgi:hypothetical protein